MATRQEFHDEYFRRVDAGNVEGAKLITDKLGYIPERDFSTLDVPQSVPQTQAAEPVATQESGSYSPLSVAGEFAAAANRGVMDVLDFFGPGSANILLGRAGLPELPTFAGEFGQTPGAQGGFMPQGLARDIVQGAGGASTAAGSFAPVAGRNLGQLGGITAELLGIGTAGPAAPSAGALLAAGRDRPQAAMAASADALGFPISPGDRYNKRTLKNVESAIESTPMPFNPMIRQSEARQRIMNESAAEAIGAPAGLPLTPGVMGDVAKDIGDEFNRLTNVDGLQATDGFLDELVGIQDASRGRIWSDPDIDRVINRVFDRIDSQGILPASEYQDITSELKKKVRQAWKVESPDVDYVERIGEVIEALDGLAQDNVSPEDLERLRDARRRWRAFTQLEKSRAVKESGDVSGALLGNYLRRTDKGGYSRGGNEGRLYEAARLSKAFPPRPNSGTAERQYLNRLIANPVGGLTTALLSPFIGSASNAYYYAPQIAKGASTPVRVSPGLTGRLGGLMEADEEEPSRLFGRGVDGGYTLAPDVGETVRPRPETDAEPGRGSDTGNDVRAILKQFGGLNDDSATQIANRLMDPALTVEEVEAMVNSGKIPRSVRAQLSKANLPQAVKNALTRFNPE